MTMTISSTDRFYRAETTPASIGRLGVALRAAYARPPDAFGAKGNLAHSSGYHRSRAWILHSPDSRRGAADYSVQYTLDHGGSENDVSAFDFTPGVWGTTSNRQMMIELTGRVLTAARVRDPRLSSLREFAGTLDGRNVVTFNCADGSLKAPFDSSHLDHVHGSFWRGRAASDHAGILAVLLGDDDMAAVQESDRSYNDLIYAAQALLDGTDVAARKNADGTISPARPNVMVRKLDALTVAFGAFAKAITDAGGSVDVAVILEAMDAKLAELAREQRDAVADLGEGGATKVRLDADD